MNDFILPEPSNPPFSFDPETGKFKAKWVYVTFKKADFEAMFRQITEGWRPKELPESAVMVTFNDAVGDIEGETAYRIILRFEWTEPVWDGKPIEIVETPYES